MAEQRNVGQSQKCCSCWWERQDPEDCIGSVDMGGGVRGTWGYTSRLEGLKVHQDIHSLMEQAAEVCVWGPVLFQKAH